MSDIAKITKLLHDESLERQMAAVIVLGELCASGPDVIHGLLRALSSDVPTLQRHAVSALSRIGARELAVCAKDALLAPHVRLDALTALRLVVTMSSKERAGSGAKPGAPFVASSGASGEHAEAHVTEALIEIASGTDRVLAQSALTTLAGLELAPEATESLAALVAHPELDRARFVIDQLGRRKAPHGTRVLIDVVRTLDRRRAEFAAGALTGNDDAVAPLAEALLETKDADRAWLMRNVLRPNAKKVPAPLREKLLERAMSRFGTGERGWEPLLDIVRDADPEAVAEALRALARKLQKQDQVAEALAVWRRICASDRATAEDRSELAALEGGGSRARGLRLRRRATTLVAPEPQVELAAKGQGRRSSTRTTNDGRPTDRRKVAR
ncbi:hypothetical protein [Pendulispora albinea]|uniref:HEAT repeat protein n=1 Tax=Pendulispora albinea TaxID=2741071 RepID=A0ABZ2M085_9BACT